MALALAAPVELGRYIIETLADRDPAQALIPIPSGAWRWQRGPWATGRRDSASCVRDRRPATRGPPCAAGAGAGRQAWIAPHLGDVRQAGLLADEGYRLAVETGQPLFVALARSPKHSSRAFGARKAPPKHYSLKQSSSPYPIGGSAFLVDIHHMRAMLALGSGRLSLCIPRVAPGLRPERPRVPLSEELLAIADFAEAAVRHGERTGALEALEHVEAGCRPDTVAPAPTGRASCAGDAGSRRESGGVVP